MRGGGETEEQGRQAARSFVWHHVWRRRRTLGTAFLGAVLYSSVVLVIPLVAEHAINDAIGDHHSERVREYVLILVGLGVLRALGTAIRKYQANKNPALVANDIRDRLFGHVQRMSFSFHDQIGVGQLMARASTDVSMLEDAIGPLPWFTQSVIMFVAGVVLLFFVQPFLAASVAFVVIVAMAFALRQARALYPAGDEVQARLGFYAQFVEQQVQGIRVVKGHGFERAYTRRADALAADVQRAGVEQARVRARFQAAMLATPGLAMLTVIGVGGYLGATGRLTAGGMLAFLLYLALLVSPVNAGAELLAEWPQGMAAAARIADVLATDSDVTEPAHPAKLASGGGAIAFEHVTFSYREHVPVIVDLDISIRAGESVALVGGSGSGKSTLAYLLCRFYDPDFGRVTLDGTAIDSVSLHTLRRAVSLVFEDTVVFTASIRANLAIGAPEAHDRDIVRAAELAEADAFIRELPDGYDTIVGPQGYSLSGGQRQRLAIARAILRDSRVLVLDDAMSAVDPPTEAAIRRGLVQAMEGRTTVIIAHRVETIALAERVVLLDRGRVIADGTHEELLQLPAYRHALALDEIDRETPDHVRRAERASVAPGGASAGERG
ncbi:MAG TPA: ABC transporter ATP-binding protein [Acidimicrobiia bacterium]